MADPLIGATAQVLLEKLVTLASGWIGLAFGIQEELEDLKKSVRMIQAVRVDAGELKKQDQRVQLWMKGLEGVAFEAYYVLDGVNYEYLKRKVEYQQQPTEKVCFLFFCSFAPNAFRWGLASKVRDIGLKLKRINQEASDFAQIRSEGRSLADAKRPQTDSTCCSNAVLVRREEKTGIIRTLDSPPKQRVSVLPVIGRRGSGKTFLVKSVCNDQGIVRNFPKIIWISVPKKVEVLELFVQILESLTGRNGEMTSRDAIVQQIRKRLVRRKFLLVLDGLHEDACEWWDDFFSSLDGASTIYGSWCILTVCDENVALNLATDRSYCCFLEKLSDDGCWSIVKEKACSSGEVPEELDDLRHPITKSCNGLALFAGIIGGILQLTDKEEWLSLVSSPSGYRIGDNERLKWCFNSLPCPATKKCLEYMPNFGKDAEIEQDRLIQIWMAEDFLQPNGDQTMEELGYHYLKSLFRSSLVDVVTKSSQPYYKLHDLVYDFLRSFSEPQKKVDGTTHNSCQVLFCELNSLTKKIVKELSQSLRTLFLTCNISDALLSKFKRLHVLCLSGQNVCELPPSIGRQKHLRYLEYTDTNVDTVPESICKLFHLQTLRTNNGSLPERLSDLISLRHLYFYKDDANFQMPTGMGRLTCLQTLPFFNIGQEHGRRIGELGTLNDLKDRLLIRNLELVSGRAEAEQSVLSEKQNLHCLELVWSAEREGANHDENVLEGLHPHCNLKELVIRGFSSTQFPEWFINLSTRQHKLVNLSLRDFPRCTELPAPGCPSSLEELTISGFNMLTSLHGERLESSTSLQKLKVYDCPNLCSFPLNLQHMTALSLIWLYNCPRLIDHMPRGFGLLPNLTEVAIGPFVDNSVTDFIFSELLSSSTITQLSLYGSPQWKSLPRMLEDFKKVTELHLHEFGIESLPEWIGNLGSLEELGLWNCANLLYLPPMTAMGKLTRLSSLVVHHCPLLLQRCSPRSGPDSEWSKISSISLTVV